MLFPILPSESSIWVTSVPLVVLANASFGASVVAMNSYLPSLAKESHKLEKPMKYSLQAHRNNAMKVAITPHLNSSAKAYKLL